MATSRDDIRRWLNQADPTKHSHMIVVVDTVDWEDHPLYVDKGQEPLEFLKDYQARMGDAYKAMECYRLDLDWETQLAENRARHWEMPETKAD